MKILGTVSEIPTKIKGWNHTFGMAKPYLKSKGNGVDVGCREGGFAREMEDSFDHVYCFDFRNKFKEFKQNVNDLTKFTYTVTGIGERDETTFTNKTGVGRIKNRGSIPVKVKTLDSFNLVDVTFIKYDIEGYELRAIQGSENTIKKYWPVVVVEQNKGNLHAVDLLKAWGYELKGIDKIFNQDYLMVKDV